ncbi:MAG: alpha-amylase [Cyanobacteriota bacterium]
MTELNGTLMQYFHWYFPADGSLWTQLKEQAQQLADRGFTALWIPPAYKGSHGGFDVGYGIYDLFDLGEFNQKNTIRTKYGTKDEFLAAVKAAREVGIQIYADVVFNHKDGGDETEKVMAVPVAFNDRNREIGPPREIEIWSKFLFPGRGDRYSSMKWDARHFDAVNHRADAPHDWTIYRIHNKRFQTEVDLNLGNYDFLMACDLDMDLPEVKQELKDWAKWFLELSNVDGFRLDALKHIRSFFFVEWLTFIQSHTPKQNLFCVGEYWSENIGALHSYISATEGRIALFDVPLHYNFHRASRMGNSFDLRGLHHNTLMQQQPTLAMTFVDNHDSQPLQALESVVEGWFKPLAYAFILLRAEGYPCVFYADYFGAHYTDRGRDGNRYEIWLDRHQWILDKFLMARQHHAFGPQYDYFDHPNCIGWTRLGNPQHPRGLAVLMSNGWDGYKWMNAGKSNTKFMDITEHISHPVWTNEWGWAEFRCRGGSVSVWVADA